MAGVRTKDRKKTSAKSKKNPSAQCRTDNSRLGSSQIMWPFSDSRRTSVYKELDVAELHWPNEDEREMSQEIVRVNPLTRHSILQAPSHKYVVSHWGRTSSLVASDLTACGSTLKDGAIKGSCTDCTLNRQENAASNHSETHPANYWMSLSDEIILAVFKLLPKKAIVKCARVCKHWQRLAYDESLWRCVDMSKVNLPPGMLGKVIKRGTRVLRLALAKVASPVCDDNALFFSDVVPLSPKSPSDSMFNLRYLDASSCSFQSDTLLCLLLHSKQLTHISLESCNVSTSVLRAMSEFRSLEILNLAMCTGLTASGLCFLLKGVKSRLKQLNLAWTNLGKSTILHVIKHLPQLRQLNLSGYREAITDDCIQVLIKSCPHLTHLDLSDCVLVTARALDEILKLKNLVHLSLSRCYNIAPAAFSCFTKMKSLKKLDIFGLLNTEGITVLKRELPEIAVNSSMFSSIARPVGSVYLGTIWGVTCKD